MLIHVSRSKISHDNNTIRQYILLQGVLVYCVTPSTAGITEYLYVNSLTLGMITLMQPKFLHFQHAVSVCCHCRESQSWSFVVVFPQGRHLQTSIPEGTIHSTKHQECQNI